jgi:3-deoxy-D-manno-octulosonic-acid transferase
VASVLRSAAVKEVVPVLSTRVERIFLCLAAILNLRNARVLFIMAKRHPVRNSQLMKAIKRCSLSLSIRKLQHKK